MGASGAASASSTAVPAPPAVPAVGTGASQPLPNVPMGMAHPSALGASGISSLTAKSALDAPLTEAQIATLPPALQAVLRKKQAQGSTPPPTGPPAPSGVSSGASMGLPEPVAAVAPATDDLTPEQRAVLAQIRPLTAVAHMKSHENT